MKGYTQIAERHLDRKAERLNSFFILKNNEKFRVGKEDIYKKGKTQIERHYNGNAYKVTLSKYS